MVTISGAGAEGNRDCRVRGRSSVPGAGQVRADTRRWGWLPERQALGPPLLCRSGSLGGFPLVNPLFEELLSALISEIFSKFLPLSGSQTINLCAKGVGVVRGIYVESTDRLRWGGGCESLKTMTRITHVCVWGALLAPLSEEPLSAGALGCLQMFSDASYSVSPSLLNILLGVHKMIVGGAWVRLLRHSLCDYFKVKKPLKRTFPDYCFFGGD